MLSYSFNVYCGVRQGGVLSPYLLNVYVDDFDLLCQFELCSLGCCIMSTYDALCMPMFVSFYIISSNTAVLYTINAKNLSVYKCC